MVKVSPFIVISGVVLVIKLVVDVYLCRKAQVIVAPVRSTLFATTIFLVSRWYILKF